MASGFLLRVYVAKVRRRQFRRMLRRADREMERQAEEVVYRNARQIRGTIRSSFRQPKSGRIVRGRLGRVYRASAPGQAPAVDTGNLFRQTQIERGSAIAVSRSGLARPARSLRVILKEDTVNTFAPGNPQQYALPLEFGAPSINLAARPHVRPAFNAQRGTFHLDLHRALTRVVRRVSQ